MEKKKGKKGDLIVNLFLILFLIGVLFSLYHIVEWFIGNKKTDEIRETMEDVVSIEKVDQSEKKEDDVTSQEEYKYRVDFKKLKQTNPETVAWLKVNGTNIEYPVVKYTDNDFYLTHSFDKSSNGAGWIFADYRNTFKENDQNIVIYGHNRRNGSMFSSLKNVLNSDWYLKEENRKIIFVTPEEQSEYEVFSIYQIEEEHHDTTTDFASITDFNHYVETAKARSIYDFGQEVNLTDPMLTLSTCANDNHYRVVLHAKKLKK